MATLRQKIRDDLHRTRALCRMADVPEMADAVCNDGLNFSETLDAIEFVRAEMGRAPFVTKAE
jgi:hypothetical protein